MKPASMSAWNSGRTDVLVDRQRLHGEDRVAELLQLVGDLVVHARVVVVRPREQHDADPLVALELLDDRAAVLAVLDEEGVLRLEALLDRAAVLVLAEAEHVLEVGQHLPLAQLALGHLHEGDHQLDALLGEDVRLLHEGGAGRVGRADHRRARARADRCRSARSPSSRPAGTRSGRAAYACA
jgi:hypothetical protein